MLTEKLQIFMRIYKQFDPCFSLICYYSFIFGLLRISIGLSVFGFVANKYQRRAIRLLLIICNIWSAIRWAIPKVILNYSRIITSDNWQFLFLFAKQTTPNAIDFVLLCLRCMLDGYTKTGQCRMKRNRKLL